MSQPAKVTIHKIPTGVRGLDDIIAGTPGCGKTTLAHQIVFANATARKPALYFTVLGEPAIKMLRYQQQYSFFDASKLGKAIRFINLSDVVLGMDLDAVLGEIVKEVTATNPGIVMVDSFRTVVRKAMAGANELEMHLLSRASPSFSPVGKQPRSHYLRSGAARWGWPHAPGRTAQHA